MRGTINEWLLPSELPFESLKGRDLEECVYWLLDSMGARDIEWRTGGMGGGAADGGRDIEATFYTPSPDGEMEAQRWWIECKGRKGTVEPAEVKNAITNAAVQKDLAYLVVATNTTFSNPTRDWVKAWQEKNTVPRVKLWDHESLERLLSKHPQVVLRLFSQALSPMGLLEFAQHRFWRRLEYVPTRTLDVLWSARSDLEINEMQLVALVANECAQGDIAKHPWAAYADDKLRYGALYIAIANLPYFFVTSHRTGANAQPIIEAVAHLMLVGLQQVEPAALSELLLAATNIRSVEALPSDVADQVLLPVVERLWGEMQDICTSDCSRLISGDLSTLSNGTNILKTYWHRLDAAGKDINEQDARYILIEKVGVPCKVGFPVNSERGCPFFAIDLSLSNATEIFSILKRVSMFRYQEAVIEAREVSKRRSKKDDPRIG